MSILSNSLLNKFYCFDDKEREDLHIHGLLPAIGSENAPPLEPSTLDYQIDLALKRFNRIKEPLDKYDWIMQLCDHSKLIFFNLLSRYPKHIMPYVYTPTVGAACQELSLVYRPGRGLFINANDKGRITEVLDNWPMKDIKAICVTDGERILGLGDLGAFGMGIPVGKLALYTALAGIPPQYLLPITLDLGTNNQKYLDDTTYFGLRKKRLTGEQYYDFIEEFMKACVTKYGKEVLIQFEDFANHSAFHLLEKYAPRYSTFNDDIQGTASVVLAGLLGSQRITKRKLKDEVIVCFGAGEAALGLAELAVRSMELRDGLTIEQAKSKIYLFDSRGLIMHDRSSGGLTDAKKQFARPAGTPETKDLNGFIKLVKATCLIGASAVPQVFTEEILKTMCSISEKPVIMALSNPTSKAECTAEQAYMTSKGQCVFCSGSPFDDVVVPASVTGTGGDILCCPGQANNAYVFPGVALAIIVGNIMPVTNDDFLVAAETVSAMATESDLANGLVFPSLDRIREVSRAIASAVITNAVKEKRSKADLSSLECSVKACSSYPFEE